MSRRSWWSVAAEGLTWIAIAAVSMLVLGYCSGCGGASAETRSSYTIEVSRCLSNERAIVDRSGTTEEQDRADLEVERARCDAALTAIYRGP